MTDYMRNYSSQNTALLIIDPFNDYQRVVSYGLLRNRQLRVLPNRKSPIYYLQQDPLGY